MAAITTAAIWHSFSGLADTSLDPFLAIVVPEVDMVIRNELNGVQLEKRTGIVDYLDGNGLAVIQTRLAPIQVVEEVKVAQSTQNGYWGAPTDSFGTDTLLTSGIDYALIRDDPKNPTWSRAGQIYRINNLWPSSWVVPPGRLSQKMVPGPGAVKITYTAGYSSSENSVPADLQLAANLLISQVKVSRLYGFLTTSEGLAEYHYQLGQLMHDYLQVGTVAAILAKYKELPV